MIPVSSLLTKGDIVKPESSEVISRRQILIAGTAITATGLSGDALGFQQAESLTKPPTSVPNYETLGVSRVINATGNITALGGSVMPPEVVAAWVEASKHFVNIIELHNKVGDRIASLIGVEAAMVTTGAAGAMLLGAAACITVNDRSLIRQLPMAGEKNEIILQKSHHSGYDNQLTDVGARLVDVETIADLERVAGQRTAMMFFMNVADLDGKISRRDWIEAARRMKIPTLLDASADVPPLSRLSEYNEMGFDLVAISGGKAMRGPNDTGLLLGRRDLIETAKLNTNPFAPTVGRMMKVGKEDMMALLAAIERFAGMDHQAEWREMERRISVIEKAVNSISTVVCERIIPPISNHQPHLIISWDEKLMKLSKEEVAAELLKSDPSIQTGRVGGTGNKGVLISVHALLDNEEAIVADRLRQILSTSR